MSRPLSLLTLALGVFLATLVAAGPARAEAPPADEGAYLGALTHLHEGRFAEAVTAARAFRTAHPDSSWAKKSRFLEAAALIELRRFEEAERVYEEEAHRLLGEPRKERIARVILEFADALAADADPDDPGAPKPDYRKAHNLYRKALDLEVGRSLEDGIRYRSARAAHRAGDQASAMRELWAYLAAFDPDWTGRVGTPERLSGLKRKNPPARGEHVFEARYLLARAQIATRQPGSIARQNLEDLLTLLPAGHALAAAARWEIVVSHGLPSGGDPDAATRAARTFLEHHPDEPRAVVAAWWIAERLRVAGRADAAMEAFRRFSESDGFRLPAPDLRDRPLEAFGKSPAALFEEWRKLAVYRQGEIRNQQRRFEDAIEAWRRYVREFPDGPQWAQAQRGIIDAKHARGMDALAQGKDDEARAIFADFLKSHPLDGRAPQVLFLLGQMHYVAAERVAASNAGDEAAGGAALYREAIESWRRLVGKYRNTNEASLALYRIGVIQEEKFGELEAALASYRQLTWGSWAAKARARVALLTTKQLHLSTERAYRTNETPRVKVSVRNVASLEVHRYTLDLEAFFRKTHGASGVEALDVALIQPDKTWTVEVGDYAKYLPLEQEIEIPFEEGRPGVCLVTVSTDTLEATTLVMRTDLELIVKSSLEEVLVFAQDRLRDAPAKGVRLLLSDGKTVFATGETGEDGVLRERNSHLRSLKGLRVFAERDGHVAAHAVDLSGLGRAAGLSPRGYVYTDRPAYAPGQTVGIRGILRGVEAGSYTTMAESNWVVSVTDSKGRMVRRVETTLSEFGTFHVTAPLDANASLGEYTVTATLKAETPKSYAGTFRVERFKLEKMRLEIEVPRPSYFRGEPVDLRVVAEYAWGEPVAGQRIRIELPDGRVLVEESDAKGVVTTRYDTTGTTPGTVMRFAARIEGEDVTAERRVPLAKLGFSLAVEPSTKVALSGEPFDVTIRARSPDGKPVARDVTLFVLRRRVVPANPVFEGVFWYRPPSRPAAEETVEEHKATTDETGEVRVRLSLGKGGPYVLRVVGKDRFGQAVTAEGAMTVSDAEDAVKLRFFSDSDTLQVGEAVVLRLHSRLDGGLALLTFDGETVLEHRVLRLVRGTNDVDLRVGHEHFPNFRVTVAALDGRELRTAAKPFTVKRELRVSVRPLAEAYEPGAPGRVEITVVDQLGRPARAELSLALVDDALYALFPDRTPPILDFFQKGARRHAEFRVVATNGFSYEGTTRALVAAIEEEAQRLVRARVEVARLAELRSGFAKGRQGGRRRDREAAAGERMKADARDAKDELQEVEKSLKRPAPAKPGGTPAAPPQPREELPEAGWWLPAVKTGADGKAVVEMPMPETTTRWRLTARGVTVETLVGEARGEVVTRKDFFVEMKAPASLLEGDEIRVLARVHDLTGEAGPVELTLSVLGGPDLDREIARKTSRLAAGSTEALFEAVKVPAATALKLVVTATSGPRADAVARTLAVRPWGIEVAAHGGGTARSDAAVSLELPGGRAYASRWLTVAVGPSVERAIVDMTLGAAGDEKIRRPGRWGAFPGTDLLAAASALAYARAVGAPGADVVRLTERTRALVASVVVTQREDGGWTWRGFRGTSNPSVTATTFWALCAARQVGLSVDAKAFDRAKAFLEKAYRTLDARDNERKAAIVHALSEGGAADFAHANRLYRERNELGTTALAHTALAFVRLDRVEIARELLGVLEGKAKTSKADGRDLCFWPGSMGRFNYHYGDDEIEATALAALALMEARPDSPRIRAAVDFLLRRRGVFGYGAARAGGPALAALTRWYRSGKYAETDNRIRVLVNGKLVRTVESDGSRPVVSFAVPSEAIGQGRVLVEFRAEGRGEYAYAATLAGFTADLKDPKSWRYPYVIKRRYLHDQLRYRGRRIGVESTSPVKHAEVGQHVLVRVDIREASAPGYVVIEEPLPAGMVYVRGSLHGGHVHHEVRDGKLVLFYPPSVTVGDFRYELVGYATGGYRALPTMIRDVGRPGRMRLGTAGELRVLAPGESSDDAYDTNINERFALGRLLFEDGLYGEALEHLTFLFEKHQASFERDVARMLLWIHTSEGHYDARRIVEVFEVLRERYPALEIPFDKILVVGRAYRDMREFERAYHVFRATIDASFVRDSGVSAVLDDEGQFLGSIDYQEDLWREYPDTAEVTAAYFALSQALYQNAPRAQELAKQARARRRDGAEPDRVPDRIDMLKEAIRLLESFLMLYPKNPLADDAAFSMANAFLDLKLYEQVVGVCGAFEKRFPKSEYETGYRYMKALGHFWRNENEAALADARVVGEGKSRDRDLARYIVGQIYHAEGKPAEAIRWYRDVAGKYVDAREAIAYFEAKRIALPEVTIVRPGEKVELKLDYRNIRETAIQVYRVDLMKLYLREKNLSTITKVRLAGIRPEVEETLALGDGKDYVDKERKIELPLKDEAAYLVICRGDDLFASGLVLVTPLKIEVQTDATSGRLRANVIDAVEGGYAPEVHVKAIGSADGEFKSGETDRRGIFVVDGLRGKPTVIARAGDSRYAFHRGAEWLGPPPQAQGRQPQRGKQKEGDLDFRQNLRLQNDKIQGGNWRAYDSMRRGGKKGVEVQQAR